MKNKLTLLSLWIITTLLISCGGSGKEDKINTHQPRIVCISKQINEYIYALGAEKDLVAVDLSSIYPPQIKNLPNVGYHRALSAEGIISMKPTLVLHDGNIAPAAVIDQVKKVGIPLEELKSGRGLDSAKLLLRQVGSFFHKDATADSVIKVWEQGMGEVLKDSVVQSKGNKPRVLIVHYGRASNIYLAITKNSPAGQMIEWAGAVNAIDSTGGMARINAEMIAKAAPDIIIATDFGFDKFGSVEKFKEMPGVSLTPAGKNGRIYRIEESEIVYFGPRTPGVLKKIKDMIKNLN
jgi:iron complex transport system substrate-binding protein